MRKPKNSFDKIMDAFDAIEDRKEARAVYDSVTRVLSRQDVFRDDDSPKAVATRAVSKSRIKRMKPYSPEPSGTGTGINQ